MASLTLRVAKGSPLTNVEIDNNFSNINTETVGNTSNVGILSQLTTTTKANLVSAVNEVNSSVIGISRGGTGQTTKAAGYNALTPITTLGDIVYGDGANSATRLAGNTTTSKKFLTQTGTGSVSAAPGWTGIVDGDLPSALTGKTYNGLTLTANATGFQIAGGTTSKTLVISNNLTFSGTDGATLNIGGGGTLGTGAYATISNYATLSSPTFTGTPAAPTAAADTNTTQIATTAYVIGQGYLKSSTASSTYAPLTGAGTSGTWGINVTGSAGSLSSYTDYMVSRGTVLDANIDSATSNGFYLHSYTGASASTLVWNTGGSTGTVQFDVGYGNTGSIRLRNKTDNTVWSDWRTFLTNYNYNSYAPSLTGGGASGTWGINVSGNAATASSVAWTNVSGRPTAVSSFTNDSAYITTSGRAYPRRSDGGDINFYWSGASGQPPWLWGGSDGTNMYVYNPSNFSVNYASSAGSASSVSASSITGQTGMYTSASRPGPYRLYRRDNDSDYSVQTYWTGTYWRLYGYNGDTGHADTYVGYADNAGYASSAGTAYGLNVHTGRNNEANKVVRTDGNGYLQTGYINSSNGDESNASNPTKVWGTNGSDSYLRTYYTSYLSVNYAASAGAVSGGLTTSNYSSYAVPLSGGTMSGQLYIRNTTPTIYFQDTDNYTAMLHCNSNIFYVLRGATDSTSWSQVGSYWPMQLDLTNNNATFGGTIWAAGDITAYSDERLKTNWASLPSDFVSKLSQIKSGTFDRTDVSGRHVGVSAQSLQTLLPEAVVLDEKQDLLSVSYGNAALAACIELAKEVVELKERIKQLEASR